MAGPLLILLHSHVANFLVPRTAFHKHTQDMFPFLSILWLCGRGAQAASGGAGGLLLPVWVVMSASGSADLHFGSTNGQRCLFHMACLVMWSTARARCAWLHNLTGLAMGLHNSLNCTLGAGISGVDCAAGIQDSDAPPHAEI